MDYSFHLENPLHHHLQNSSGDNHHDKFTTLFHIESQHTIPGSNSIDSGTSSSIRLQIISNIRHFSIRFDPFLRYLAVNYLDRFLATQSVLEGKPWILRLIAISCVSLALKMRKTENSAADNQNDGGGIIFDSQTRKRMELLILGALKWRMRSITPFAFIDFFVSVFKFKDRPSCQALKDRATEIIFKAQNGLQCYEFKPSTVAGSALLSACGELFPLQYPCFTNAISSCPHVHKDDFNKCYNMIQEIAMDEGYEPAQVDTLSTSSTPVNVLNIHCMSTETEIEMGTEEATNGGGGTGSENETIKRDLQRRKMKCFGSQNSFQLSQIQQC